MRQKTRLSNKSAIMSQLTVHRCGSDGYCWPIGNVSSPPKNAKKYLLDDNAATHFQLHILANIVIQPWVSRLWLKTSRHRDDIFDWLESVFKPKFRGVIKGFCDLGDVQSVQWDWLVHTILTLVQALPFPQKMAKNLSALSELLNLNNTESKILEFALARDLDADYSRFIDMLIDTDRQGSAIIARILKISTTQFNNAFSESGVLRNIVFQRGINMDLDLDPTIKDVLISKDLLTLDSILTALVSKSPPCELNRKHFDHLEIAQAIDYLSICLKKRKKGVNVLLYGPPGTGKTQLSRLLTESAEALLFHVDHLENDRHDRQTPRSNRITLAQKVLARVDQAILCVDECEDIFERPFFGEASPKIKLNGLLEDSMVPTIWITNWIHLIEPSLLRRFDRVIKVDPPTKSQKAKIYRKQLRNLKVNNHFCKRLASNETLAQGHIASAAKVAATLGYAGEQAQECIESLLEEQLQPLGGTLKKTDTYQKPFTVQSLPI